MRSLEVVGAVVHMSVGGNVGVCAIGVLYIPVSAMAVPLPNIAGGVHVTAATPAYDFAIFRRRNIGAWSANRELILWVLLLRTRPSRIPRAGTTHHLFPPAVGVADGDHRTQDVVPRLALHHDVVGKHAAVPTDVAEGLGQVPLFIAEPMAGVLGDIQLAAGV